MRSRRSGLIGLGSLSLCFAALAPLSACLESTPVAPGADASPIDEPATEVEWDILPRIADGAYRGEGFVRISSAPYPSEVAPEVTIDVWVSAEGWWDYLRVAPDASGSGASLPVGTIVVREVLGQDGIMQKLTVMARAPAGYSPGHGDFWYGVLDVDGWPTWEAGEPIMGTLEERCASCHAPRATDGFLYGVPTVYREPSLPHP